MKNAKKKMQPSKTVNQGKMESKITKEAICT